MPPQPWPDGLRPFYPATTPRRPLVTLWPFATPAVPLPSFQGAGAERRSWGIRLMRIPQAESIRPPPLGARSLFGGFADQTTPSPASRGQAARSLPEGGRSAVLGGSA